MLSLRWIGLIASVLFLLMLMPLGFSLPDQQEKNRPPLGIFHTASELVTLRVPVAEVIELKKQGYLGGTRLLGTVRGELLIGCQLDQANVLRIDHDQQQLIVELPEPELLHLKLLAPEHPPSVQRIGLWQLAPMPAHEAALSHRASLQAAELLSRSPELAEAQNAAKNHTESVLAELFAGHGWTVIVKWIK